MYDHPLATYYPPRPETNGLGTCNSWGYVSGLTEAYFEKEEPEARQILLMYLTQSKAPYYHIKSLLRLYKKYKHLSFLREIQCLVVSAIESEVEQQMEEAARKPDSYAVIQYEDQGFYFDEDYEDDDEDYEDDDED